MDDMSKQLIKHCSPTLAGMKTAGLFAYSFTSELALTNSLCLLNRLLNPKGVYAVVLRVRDSNALIYVYRRSALFDDLNKLNVKAFLEGYGYRGGNTVEHIEQLKRRFLCGSDFPHEIGLFLGYPLHDVYGFIHNKGQNSKCSGYWKVYGKESDALKLFAKFNKCRDIYTKLFLQGRPIERLIVPA